MERWAAMKTAIVVWLAGVALGIGTLVAVRSDPSASLTGASTLGAVALLGAGWTLITVGVVVGRRIPTRKWAPLLVGAGVAWFLTEWNNPGVGSPLVFTVGLIFYAACPTVVAHAALAYPSGRLASGAERVTVGVAVLRLGGRARPRAGPRLRPGRAGMRRVRLQPRLDHQRPGPLRCLRQGGHAPGGGVVRSPRPPGGVASGSLDTGGAPAEGRHPPSGHRVPGAGGGGVCAPTGAHDVQRHVRAPRLATRSGGVDDARRGGGRGRDASAPHPDRDREDGGRPRRRVRARRPARLTGAPAR